MPLMDSVEATQRIRGARSAQLATTNAKGRVDLVPIVFTCWADERGTLRIGSAVDHKPKTTTRLTRLNNIKIHPQATLLWDSYSEDWATLWWVRARTHAEVAEDGVAFDRVVDALVEKYPQYTGLAPGGPVIVMRTLEITGWKAE